MLLNGRHEDLILLSCKLT